MVGLKTETKMPADSISEMPYQSPDRTEVIDATISPKQHIEEMLKKRLNWGKDRYTECNVEVERRATIIEQRQEAIQQAKRKLTEADKGSQNEPFEKFVRAWKNRNNDIAQLSNFLKTESVQKLQTLAAQLESNPRHFQSLFQNQVGSAIFALQQTLVARSTENKNAEEALSFWLRVQKAFGMKEEKPNEKTQ